MSLIASIKLLKIMTDGHIANTHFKELINWHYETLQSTTSSGYSTNSPLIKSKKKIIAHLDEILYSNISPKLSMKPQHNVIMLPSLRSTKISKINLLPSLFSLLTDPQLMSNENLLLLNVIIS